MCMTAVLVNVTWSLTVIEGSKGPRCIWQSNHHWKALKAPFIHQGSVKKKHISLQNLMVCMANGLCVQNSRHWMWQSQSIQKWPKKSKRWAGTNRNISKTSCMPVSDWLMAHLDKWKATHMELNWTRTMLSLVMPNLSLFHVRMNKPWGWKRKDCAKWMCQKESNTHSGPCHLLQFKKNSQTHQWFWRIEWKGKNDTSSNSQNTRCVPQAKGVHPCNIFGPQCGLLSHRIESKKMCTLVFPWKKHEMQVLRMGLCSGPCVFQETMSAPFANPKHMRTHTDNALIATNGDPEDHLEKLDVVLRKLKRAGLKIDANESFFCQHKSNRSGHWLTREHLQPLPDKVEGKQRIAMPKRKKTMRSWWTNAKICGWDNPTCCFLQVKKILREFGHKNTPTPLRRQNGHWLKKSDWHTSIQWTLQNAHWCQWMPTWPSQFSEWETNWALWLWAEQISTKSHRHWVRATGCCRNSETVPQCVTESRHHCAHRPQKFDTQGIQHWTCNEMASHMQRVWTKIGPPQRQGKFCGRCPQQTWSSTHSTQPSTWICSGTSRMPANGRVILWKSNWRWPKRLWGVFEHLSVIKDDHPVKKAITALSINNINDVTSMGPQDIQTLCCENSEGHVKVIPPSVIGIHLVLHCLNNFHASNVEIVDWNNMTREGFQAFQISPLNDDDLKPQECLLHLLDCCWSLSPKCHSLFLSPFSVKLCVNSRKGLSTIKCSSLLCLMTPDGTSFMRIFSLKPRLKFLKMFWIPPASPPHLMWQSTVQWEAEVHDCCIQVHPQIQQS